MPLYPTVSQIAEGRTKGGGTTRFCLPGVEFMGLSTRALTALRLWYFPMYIVTTIAIDQLICEVTSPGAGGTTIRLGIYNADTDWQPTSLVIDAGTVAADSPGVKTASISQALAPGRYVLALHSDSAATVRAFRGGARYAGFETALGTSPFVNSIYKAGVAYAVLASTGVAWDTVSAGTVPVDNLVLCRVSTP